MLSSRSLKRRGEQFPAWMVESFPYLIDLSWYPMECFTLRLVTISNIDMQICLLLYSMTKLSIKVMVAEILWFFVFPFSFPKLVIFADLCSCEN